MQNDNIIFCSIEVTFILSPRWAPCLSPTCTNWKNITRTFLEFSIFFSENLWIIVTSSCYLSRHIQFGKKFSLSQYMLACLISYGECKWFCFIIYELCHFPLLKYFKRNEIFENWIETISSGKFLLQIYSIYDLARWLGQLMST